MSTPRNGDGPEGTGGFDDRPDDQRGWSEPTHLGDGATGSTPERSTPEQPADRAWEPPGWSLPDAAPDRPAQPPVPSSARPPVDGPPPQQDREASSSRGWDLNAADHTVWNAPQAPPQEEKRGGLLGGLLGRGPRKPSEVQQAFQPRGGGAEDLAAWGQAHGWTASDGTGKEDELLVELTRSAPVRPARSEVPSNVLRGRADGLDLVAFDIVSPYGKGWVATHAVTAAPVLGQLPGFRLTPARFWRHGTGGLLQIPSGDPEFDTRWVMLAAEDAPQLRRVVEDPVVRQALLGSDDGDELWSAVGFVAAIRPDGHRPLLVEHQARILAAVTSALGSFR